MLRDFGVDTAVVASKPPELRERNRHGFCMSVEPSILQKSFILEYVADCFGGAYIFSVVPNTSILT